MSSLQVADSFLVDGGKVRGIELHRERFVRSCAAAGVSAEAFWDEQAGRLPGFGRWFPRFELRMSGELAVQLRPAPPIGGRVRVAVAWWEDDTLCFPPSDRPLLPSVTAQLLRRIATTQGVPVVEHPITPADLQATTEAWLINALHGIRPIHAWSDSAIDPLPNSHSTTWQSNLNALAAPL